MATGTAYCHECGYSFQAKCKSGMIKKIAKVGACAAGGAALGLVTGGAGALAAAGVAAGVFNNINNEFCHCPKCGATCDRPD